MSTISPADRLEILDLLARNSHAIDLGQPHDYAATFAEGGRMTGQASPRRGGAVKYDLVGRPALEKFAADAFAKRQGYGRHWVGNTALSASGDDTVSGMSYLFFQTVDPDTLACAIMVSAVHRDLFRRGESGWEIAERLVAYDG
jgi:hypothetical protein